MQTWSWKKLTHLVIKSEKETPAQKVGHTMNTWALDGASLITEIEGQWEFLHSGDTGLTG